MRRHQRDPHAPDHRHALKHPDTLQWRVWADWCEEHGYSDEAIKWRRRAERFQEVLSIYTHCLSVVGSFPNEGYQPEDGIYVFFTNNNYRVPTAYIMINNLNRTREQGRFAYATWRQAGTIRTHERILQFIDMNTGTNIYGTLTN